VHIQVLTSDEAPVALLADVHLLLTDAFAGSFSDDDWQHTLGGWHVIGSDAGAVVSHAAVVPRTIRVGDDPFRTGYAEGVATHRDRQGRGLGSQVMTQAAEVIRHEFELGVLSTDKSEFYEKLGWEHWQGPTFVRIGGRLVRTDDDDGGIMVLRFGPSQDIDLTAAVSCDSRPGDDW